MVKNEINLITSLVTLFLVRTETMRGKLYKILVYYAVFVTVVIIPSLQGDQKDTSV